MTSILTLSCIFYCKILPSVFNVVFCFCMHAEVTDKQLKNNEDFIWPIDVPLTGKFIIDVEFLDLKAASPNVCTATFIIQSFIRTVFFFLACIQSGNGFFPEFVMLCIMLFLSVIISNYVAGFLIG